MSCAYPDPEPDSDGAVFLLLNTILPRRLCLTCSAAMRDIKLRTISAAAVQVVTAGGGGVNDKWTQMRAERLGVPVQRATQSEAAYGSALLARRGRGLASKAA